MIVALDAKRRVTISATIAPLKPGDQFKAIFDADEDAIIPRRLPRRKNWRQVMKKCPVPIDDPPLRSRELPRKRKF